MIEEFRFSLREFSKKTDFFFTAQLCNYSISYT